MRLPGQSFPCIVICLLLVPGTVRTESTIFQQLKERALALTNEGKLSEAIPYWKKMVELQPYNEKALYQLALVLLLQEKELSPDEARKQATEAVHLLEECVRLQLSVSNRGPDAGLRFFYLGMALWYSGESLRAVSAFENSYRADFQRVDAIYNQATILAELGYRERSDQTLARYRELAKKLQQDD